MEDDRTADSTLKLLAQLGATVIDLVTVGCEDPSTRLGQIALDAELAGLPWVARLARGLGEAALVALGSPAWRLTACVELLGECERAGDDWGAALLRLAAAIAGQLADPAADPDEFTDAASRFRRLDAPVLALWAESLQACVLARDGRPGAGEFAHRVATQARALHLEGAQALAIAALAVAAGGDQRPARIVIGDTANSEGVRGAMRLLTGRGRPTTARVQPVPAPATFAPAPSASMSSDVLRSVAPTGTSAPDNALHPKGDAAPPPLVQVRCFGGFGIDVDGMAVELGQLRPRARALLRLLALSPDRDVHREHLIDALWPGVDLTDRDPPAAGGGLQRPAGARTGRLAGVGGGGPPG